MSAKYEELIAAGAPRLPEGCYYKIVPERGPFEDYVDVEVWRERRMRADKRLDWTCMPGNHVEGVKDLAGMCRTVYDKAFPPPVEVATWLKPFIGRHP